jgi:hypothetical protein
VSFRYRFTDTDEQPLLPSQGLGLHLGEVVGEEGDVLIIDRNQLQFVPQGEVVLLVDDEELDKHRLGKLIGQLVEVTEQYNWLTGRAVVRPIEGTSCYELLGLTQIRRFATSTTPRQEG